MNDKKNILFKGVISGLIFGFLWAIELTLGFLISGLIIPFLISISSMVLLSYILANINAKYIFLEVLISILPAIISFIFIIMLGSIDWAFHYGMEEDINMTAGDGFGMMFETIIYMFFTIFSPFIAYFIGRKRR